MSKRPHDDTAKRIAKKYGGQYNPGKGADVPLPKITIEVETENSINDAPRQLQGYQGPVYLAATTQKGVKKAMEKVNGTTIGVMDKEGEIVKKSTRKKRIT